jgi:hypothetical protein
MHITSNCWICEGWSHLEFKILVTKVEEFLKDDDFRDRFFQKYGVHTKVQVNLHMSFDGYKPHKMFAQ